MPFGGGNFEDMMRQMGGLGGAGLGEGPDGLDGFEDDDEPEGDSDDEKLPELEETTPAANNGTTG